MGPKGEVLKDHADGASRRHEGERPGPFAATLSRNIIPASGRSRPAAIRSAVVLPEPLGPNRQTACPWSTTHEKLASTGMSRQNCFAICLNSITGIQNSPSFSRRGLQVTAPHTKMTPTVTTLNAAMRLLGP